MRLCSLLSLLVVATPFCLADVEFTKPAAGAAIAAGALSIAWKDSGDSPSLDDLTTYQIDLMAGGDTDADSVRCEGLLGDLRMLINESRPSSRISFQQAQSLGIIKRRE